MIALLLASASSAADEVVVRVRLLDGLRSIELIGATGEKTRVTRSGSEIQVDGGPRVSSWQSRGQGPVRIVAPKGASSAAQGRGLVVRGRVAVRGTENGLRIVNLVPLESYVEGTLGSEMFSSWHPQALRAQAVACRTYAVHQIEAHRNERFDVEADVTSQAYGGVAAESKSARSATRATRGEVLRFGGRPVLAAYHSASGGRTASSEEVWGQPIPYLRSVEVEDESDSPDTYWRLAVDAETLGEALASIGHPVGTVRSAEIRERSGSARVRWIEFFGSHGRARIAGRRLRAALGEDSFKSTIFEVRTGNRGVVFVGTGRGHGVGMSQWAAQAMAKKGADYRDILHTFYPGTELGLLDEPRTIPAVSARGAQRPAAAVGVHAQ